MKQCLSRRQCLSRTWWAFPLLGLFVWAWAAFINVAIPRSLGTFHVSSAGQPMSLTAEFLENLAGGALCAVVFSLVFAIALVLGRRRFRCWLMLTSIAFLGTPMAFFGGRGFSRHVWPLDRAGVAWGEIVPVVVGLLGACLVGVVLDMRMNYLERVCGDRWAGLPSFGVVYVLSLGVLVAFATWTIVDASFSHVLDFVMRGLRPGRYLDTNLGTSHAWDVLGSRVALFGFFTGLGAIALTVIIVRWFVGSASGRSIRSMMLTTALIAAWLSLFVSYGKLNCLGLQFRVRRALPSFKHVARQLLNKWPVGNGSLPEAGEFSVLRSDCGDRLFFYSAPWGCCAFRETFGHFVWRLPGGGLEFSLLPETDWEIQYCPKGQVPRYYVVCGTGYEVLETIELERCWYLTRSRATVP